MTENFAGVVEHTGNEELELQAHFLGLAAHYARHRRLAWWTGLGGLAARVVAVSLIAASLPLDLESKAQGNPLVMGLAVALYLASSVGLIACVCFYAKSRGRSAWWGLLAFLCGFVFWLVALVILLVIEDFGYEPARLKLEQYGAADIPAPRPSAAAIGALLALTLLFAGIGAARVTKVFKFNLARFEQQAKLGPKGRLPVGLPGAETAEAAEAARDVDAGPLPDFAKRPCLVGSEPTGAAILLDGQPTGKTTPSEITIWAGRDHTVRVVMEGYAPAEQGVFAGLSDKPQLQLKLAAYPKVEVATEPEGAQVYVDGVLKLPATPGWFYADTKDPTLVVKKAGFVEASHRPAFEAGQPASVSLKLVPAFTVSVESKPEGAAIILDGVKTALKTPAVIAVAAGKKHELRLEHEGITTPVTKLKPLKAGAETKVVVDVAAALRAELKAKIKRLSAEVAKWDAALRRLEAKETGFADSIAGERKLQADLDRTQKKVDDLQAELDAAREELSALP